MSADQRRPDDPFAEAFFDVMSACARLTDVREREHLVLTAWQVVAQQVRGEQLFAPGGYQTERDRQLLELEKAAAFVREDEPDLESERLLREGNAEQLLDYLRRRRDELLGGGPADVGGEG